MKIIRVCLLAAITVMFLAAPCFAESNLGKSKKEVIEEMGSPSETIRLDDKCEILFYKVSEGGLVSITSYQFCEDKCVSYGRSSVMSGQVYKGDYPYYRFPEFYDPIRRDKNR